MSATRDETAGYRILIHPVLGEQPAAEPARITLDGRILTARAGEPIAAALLAHGIRVQRTLPVSDAPRGLFCGVGRCGDCLMTVDGEPGVRACITLVRDGMARETQDGVGHLKGRA